MIYERQTDPHKIVLPQSEIRQMVQHQGGHEASPPPYHSRHQKPVSADDHLSADIIYQEMATERYVDIPPT